MITTEDGEHQERARKEGLLQLKERELQNKDRKSGWEEKKIYWKKQDKAFCSVKGDGLI